MFGTNAGTMLAGSWSLKTLEEGSAYVLKADKPATPYTLVQISLKTQHFVLSIPVTW